MTPFIAEILGTGLLILLGCGVVANAILKGTKGNGGGWIIITTAWGLGVFAGVVVAGPISGAHLNPAVTIGLAIAGIFPWHLVGSYILAQMIGAMIGASLVYLMYKDHFDLTEDSGLKRAVFCTDPAIPNNYTNILSEILGTFVLLICVFYFADGTIDDGTKSAKVGLGSIGAIPVAFVVWGIGLSLGGTTGYAINPARDLGPRIVHAFLPIKGKTDSGWSYSWIPIVGPLIGAALAAILYLILG